MINLQTVIFIDIFTLMVCVFLLIRHGRIAHSHPLTIYLFFHIYVVTLRLLAVFFGAPTLFSDWGNSFSPVTIKELIRAALLFDVALVLATAASLKATFDDSHMTRRQKKKVVYEENLSSKYINFVVAFTIPLGLVGLFLFAKLPLLGSGPGLSSWSQSSWLTISVTWFGLSLIALIYTNGFRPLLTFFMLLYLMIMAYQGYHRFRVIIPIFLMLQIYLDRHDKHWPNIRFIATIIILGLLFFPLKDIGQGVQRGESAMEIVGSARLSINQVLTGQSGDQEFLDQFAASLTLIDEQDTFSYGKTYLALLTLPVPREWWPEKPGLADWIEEISRPWRPMDSAGMIATYLGETYANFWYFGIILLPVLFFYFLTRFYFWAYHHPYYSIVHFTYLLIAVNLIQVYRDGLVSIIVFVFVNMMPLALIVFLHLVAPMQASSKRRYKPQTQQFKKPDFK